MAPNRIDPMGGPSHADLIAEMLGLDTNDEKDALLKEQLRQVLAQTSDYGQREFKTPAGAAVSGIGEIIRSVSNARQAKGLRDQLGADEQTKATVRGRSLRTALENGYDGQVSAEGDYPPATPAAGESGGVPADVASAMGISGGAQLRPAPRSSKMRPEQLSSVMAASGDPVLARFGGLQLHSQEEAKTRQEKLADVASEHGWSDARMARELAARSEEAAANRAGEMSRTKLELGTRKDLAAEAAAREEAKDKRKATTDLRDELEHLPASKALQEIAVSYDKMRQAAAKPSPAGDMAMAFSLMRLFDPTSSVREGEYATAAAAGGVPDRIVGAYNKAINGEMLSPSIRADFLKQGAQIYGAHKAQFDRLADQYRGFAAKRGASAEDVVPDFGLPDQATPTGRFKLIGGVRFNEMSDGTAQKAE